MNLEDGDQFERETADWIRYNLPTYETLWGEFIGNDGTAAVLKSGQSIGSDIQNLNFAITIDDVKKLIDDNTRE